MMATLDRGYSWLVLVAACILQLLGLGFSIGGVGVSLISFQKVFPQADVGQISWIGSLRAFQFLASPVAVLLIKRFGCRAVTIAGALLSAAGIAISTLSTELWHAYLTFGVITGFGVAFTYTCSTTVVGEYFDKKKHIAFPVVCLGNSLGLLICPYLLQTIFDKTSHEVALYIMASFKIVEIACGVIFKPNTTDAMPPAIAGAPTTDIKDHNGNEEGKIAMHIVNGSTNPRFQMKTVVVDGQCAVKSHEASPLTGGSRDSVKRGQVAVIPEKAEGDSAGDNSDVAGGPAPAGVGQGRNAFLRMAYLLKDWKCWALVMNALCWGVTVVSTEVLAPISLQNRGLDDANASLGVTILGAGMILSSFIMLGLGARKYDRVALYLPTCGTLGVLAILLSISIKIEAYFTLCSLFGFLFGILISLYLSVLAEFKEPEDFADLFGLYILFNGVGGFAGPAIMGTIQAAFNDSVGWYFIGGVGILGTAVLVPAFVIRRRQLATE